MDPEIKVANKKDILKNLDLIIKEATLSSFNEFLSPLLEDERDNQDDMSDRTKALDAAEAAEEMDEAEDDEEETKDKQQAVDAATGKKTEEEQLGTNIANPASKFLIVNFLIFKKTTDNIFNK